MSQVEALRLLAVLPHPDDESLNMGGALAKYAAEGVETHLVCATRGERGWAGPAEENPGPEALGRIREAELHCAASRLGLHAVSFLDIIDGTLDTVAPAEVIGKIAAHIRRIRPQVVATFAPDGNYGHPDHIALAQFTAGALPCAADASFHDPEGRPPFRVSKFYHIVDSKAVVEAIRAALGFPIGFAVDGVMRGHVGWEEWAITTRIDASAYIETVREAILCHQSQVPGFWPLLELPPELTLRVWGEGCFVRIYSLVNGGRAVERDLFEGLRAP